MLFFELVLKYPTMNFEIVKFSAILLLLDKVEEKIFLKCNAVESSINFRPFSLQPILTRATK